MRLDFKFVQYCMNFYKFQKDLLKNKGQIAVITDIRYALYTHMVCFIKLEATKKDVVLPPAQWKLYVQPR